MKTIRIIAISGILLLCLYGTAQAQQNQANKTPLSAEQVVTSIDKQVKLSEDQKKVLQKRAASIIEKRKATQVATKEEARKMAKDSTNKTIPAVLDSLLTSEQKEIMRQIRQRNCEKAIKELSEKK